MRYCKFIFVIYVLLGSFLMVACSQDEDAKLAVNSNILKIEVVDSSIQQNGCMRCCCRASRGPSGRCSRSVRELLRAPCGLPLWRSRFCDAHSCGCPPFLYGQALKQRSHRSDGLAQSCDILREIRSGDGSGHRRAYGVSAPGDLFILGVWVSHIVAVNDVIRREAHSVV